MPRLIFVILCMLGSHGCSADNTEVDHFMSKLGLPPLGPIRAGGLAAGQYMMHIVNKVDASAELLHIAPNYVKGGRNKQNYEILFRNVQLSMTYDRIELLLQAKRSLQTTHRFLTVQLCDSCNYQNLLLSNPYRRYHTLNLTPSLPANTAEVRVRVTGIRLKQFYSILGLLLISTNQHPFPIQPSQPKSRHVRETSESTVLPGCHMIRWRVTISSLDWNKYVLFPKSFQANLCVGRCTVNVTRYSNHAFIRHTYNARNPDENYEVAEPCCVPTKVSPVTIIYINDIGNMASKLINDVKVEECGCL